MKKNIFKYDVASRLKEFGKQNFNTMSEFAKAIDMKPQALYSSYLSGRSIPGPEILIKLSILGCDIHWLLTGENKSPPSIIERDEKIKELEAEINTLRDELSQVINHLQALTSIEKFIEAKRGKTR